MKEPLTLSGKVGSTRYLIPTALQKRRGLVQWFFSDETIQDSTLIDGLFHRALQKEEVFCEEQCMDAGVIFSIFIKKLLSLSVAAGCSKSNSIYIFAVEVLNERVVELLTSVCKEMGIEENQMRIYSYKESFAHYVMKQEKNVFANEVILFEYRHPYFKEYRLIQERRMKPVVLSIDGRQSFVFEEMEQLSVQTTEDELFYQVVANAANGKVVSSIFLVGDGFEGDWMEKSKQKLCQGRRVV